MEDIYREAARCRRCPLGALPENAARLPNKQGTATCRLLVVSQNPGQRTVRPHIWGGLDVYFGRYPELRAALRDVWITNLVKCRTPANRAPRPAEVAACASWLRRELAGIRPAAVIALGRPAADWLRANLDGTPLAVHAHPSFMGRFRRRGLDAYFAALLRDIRAGLAGDKDAARAQPEHEDEDERHHERDEQ